MRYNKYAKRVDENQKELVKVILECGMGWLDMHSTASWPVYLPNGRTLRIGHDGFIVAKGRLFPVEVKKPCFVGDLTENERNAEKYYREMRVPFTVIATMEDVYQFYDDHR